MPVNLMRLAKKIAAVIFWHNGSAAVFEIGVLQAK